MNKFLWYQISRYKINQYMNLNFDALYCFAYICQRGNKSSHGGNSKFAVIVFFSSEFDNTSDEQPEYD